jgi:hypothetical protein
MAEATKKAEPAKADKYAPVKRAMTPRELRRHAEKLRRNVRNKRNARHG